MPYINNEANIPYRMDNLTRGYCIIFNVAVVEGRFRDGSHVDVRKLKQTFQFLGFVVSVIDNPSKLEINRTLRNCKLYPYLLINKRILKVPFKECQYPTEPFNYYHSAR